MAKIRKIVFFIFLLLGYLPHLYSQDLKFERIFEGTMLSQSTINSICQDNKGFMWFGTNDGLVRYDGYITKVYKYRDTEAGSISGNLIWCVYEDKNGTIWIGTYAAGMCKYNRATDKFSCYKHEPTDSSTISSNSILSIYEDKHGVLWLGTYGGGLNKFDRTAETFTRYLQGNAEFSNNLNNIKVIYEDLSGTFWVGTTGGGLFIFDRENETFTPKFAPQLDKKYIHAITESSDGLLWFAADKIYKYNNNTLVDYDFLKSVNNVATAILTGSQNTLWLGSYNGLILFNYHQNTQIHYKQDIFNIYSLSGKHVLSLNKDSSGIIWTGTEKGGVNKLDPHVNNFIYWPTIRRAPYSEVSKINCFYVDSNDKLIIGTNWGLIKYCDGKYKYNIPNDRFTNEIFQSYFIIKDSRNNFWFGTDDGLKMYSSDKDRFYNYRFEPQNPYGISHKWVRAGLEDRFSNLWFGTEGGGLNLFNRETQQFSHFKHNPADSSSLSHDHVFAIVEDSFGELWLGTQGGGLCNLDRESGKFTTYKHLPGNPYSLSNNQVYAIYEQDTTLWIGTAAGLNKFLRKSNQFERYTTENGMPTDLVTGIISDNNKILWLTTTNGIIRFNPEGDEYNRFRFFGHDDGIKIESLNNGAITKTKSGEIWVGGNHGYIRFNPDSLCLNQHVPPMALTNFKIANETTTLDSNIVEKKIISLNHQQNFFSFEFAALDYANPAKNQYAYKLEGFDKEWVRTGNVNFANFTNVPPGRYTFRVKASNNDGVWNEDGISIAIVISPPWWKTYWAYSAYIILLLVIYFSVKTYESKRLLLRNELKMQKFEAQKLQEIDKMKSGFFTNISHEFRTPLTLILGPIEQMLSGKFRGNLKENYRMILRNGERLLELINQLLDISKLEAGQMTLDLKPVNFVSLAKGITLSFSSFAERINIKLDFNSTKDSIPCKLDQDKIEKIITNLLSNAFKFVSENGEIIVSVDVVPAGSTNSLHQSETSEIIRLSVADNGTGIAEEYLDKIFDRFYQAPERSARGAPEGSARGSQNTSTRKFGGTGIGLAVSRDLVELHQGQILVKSELGHGAEFIVNLPLTEIPLHEQKLLSDDLRASNEKEGISKVREVQQMPLPTHLNESHAPKETAAVILVVEDNQDVRTYIRSHLEPSYSVVEAIDGAEGIEKAIGISPDLIISDVMMPNLDGFELCRTLKTDERTSHIPVILLTAKASEDSKIEGLETGADDYIIKPFNAKELLSRTKNLILLRKRLRERFSREMNLLPKEITVTSADERFLQRAIALVEEHISDTEFTVEQFVNNIGMSQSQLHRKLKALTNLSALQFIRVLRLKRAAYLLQKKHGNVAEITYEVGFNNPSYFAECFRKQFGVLPSRFAAYSPPPDHDSLDD